MAYREEDYLQISGIQHFAFCRRQWALIHIEQQWQDNARTVGGDIFHARAHDRAATEKRGNRLTVRGLCVFSAELGVSGECDVVEFTRDDALGAPLNGYEGRWLPTPVEYKSGEAKIGDEDRLQLCVQAMCLKEMLGCPVDTAFLYYGKNNQREAVPITAALCATAKEMLLEMHAYMQRGYTPKVKPDKHCGACSLKDICLPVLCKNRGTVASYIESIFIGEDGS